MKIKFSIAAGCLLVALVMLLTRCDVVQVYRISDDQAIKVNEYNMVISDYRASNARFPLFSYDYIDKVELNDTTYYIGERNNVILKIYDEKVIEFNPPNESQNE